MKSIPSTGLLTGAAKGVASGARAVKTGSAGFLAIFAKATGSEPSRAVTQPFVGKNTVSDSQSSESKTASAVPAKATAVIPKATRAAVYVKRVDADIARTAEIEHAIAESAPENVGPDSKKATAASAKPPVRAATKDSAPQHSTADRNMATPLPIIGEAQGAPEKPIVDTKVIVTPRSGENTRHVNASLRRSMSISETASARGAVDYQLISAKIKSDAPAKITESAAADNASTRRDTSVTEGKVPQRSGSASGRIAVAESILETSGGASPREIATVRIQPKSAAANGHEAWSATGNRAARSTKEPASETIPENRAEPGVAPKIRDKGEALGQRRDGEKPFAVERVVSHATRRVWAENIEKTVEGELIPPRQAERSAGEVAKSEEKVLFARMTQSEKAAPLRVLAKKTPVISVTTKGNESRSAVTGHARETDRVIDRFWQERLTPKSALAPRVEVVSPVTEGGMENSLPTTQSRNAEVRVPERSSAPTLEHAQRTEKVTAREDASTETRLTRVVTAVPASSSSRKSVWGIRIGSGESPVKAAQPGESRIQAVEAKRAETPDKIVVDTLKPRAVEVRERAIIAKDAPKTVPAQNVETPLPKTPALSERAVPRPTAEPKLSSRERIEIKPHTVLRQEAAAEARTTVSDSRASEPRITPVVDSSRVQSGRKETTHAATSPSERIAPQTSQAHAKYGVRAATPSDVPSFPANRSAQESPVPERAPHDTQTKATLQENGARTSAKSAVGNEAPAKAAEIRVEANAAETRIASRFVTQSDKAENVTRRAEFPAAKVREESAPLLKAIVQESRSISAASTSAAGATTPTERVRVDSERTNEPARDSVQVRNLQETHQPKPTDLPKVTRSQDHGERAAVARGESEPLKQVEVSRSGQNTAQSAQRNETAPVNLKASTSVREPLKNSAPTEQKMQPTESRTTTKTAAPVSTPPAKTAHAMLQDAPMRETKASVTESRAAAKPVATADARPAEGSSLQIHETLTNESKTSITAPRPTTKPVFVTAERPAETTRLPVHDTRTDAKKATITEANRAAKASLSTDARTTASARLPEQNVMTSAARTATVESRVGTKAAFPSDARSAEVPRLSVHDALTNAAKTAISEPRKVTKLAPSTTPASIGVSGEESQKAAGKQTGERPAASIPTPSTEVKAAATLTPLATPPHRARLSVEQVRELQAMVTRTMQNARTNAFGESSTRFSLQHATLGALQFRVTTRRDDVAVEISSPNRETIETLEEARPAVERAMADAGLRVERFEIRLRDPQAIQDSMNRSLENDHQPMGDRAAEESARLWDGSEALAGDAEEAIYERPQLAEHEWVA